MGTGGKIAIGCGIAALVGVLVVVLTVGAGIFWVKGKAESIAAEQKQITDLQEQANKNPFTEPEDGVISEPRLLKFIEVRKRVYDVYVKNEAAIKALADDKQEKASLGDVRKAFALMNEIRLVQATAQVAEGMSDAEYAFLVQQVYKSSWAAGVADATGGQSVSEAVGQAYDRAAEQMEKAGGTVTAGDQAAREAAQSLDVPAANVELFRKHETELKKYAMSGLEWIGL